MKWTNEDAFNVAAVCLVTIIWFSIHDENPTEKSGILVHSQQNTLEIKVGMSVFRELTNEDLCSGHIHYRTAHLLVVSARRFSTFLVLHVVHQPQFIAFRVSGISCYAAAFAVPRDERNVLLVISFGLMRHV